jgi:hypothetical protein
MSLAPLMRIEMPESLFPPKRLKSLAFGGTSGSQHAR